MGILILYDDNNVIILYSIVILTPRFLFTITTTIKLLQQEYMALQIAAHEGHSAVVELLLDRGVDIWEHVKCHVSPVYAFVINIVNSCSNIFQRNTMAFEIAARRGHAAVVEVLAKREVVKLDYRVSSSFSLSSSLVH